MTPKEKLEAHSAEFEKEVVNVAEGVYTAVGFAASNVTMIEGETGLIIVDTTESIGAAEIILTKLRQISDKPILAIIYTHSHRDHISGASVFAGDASPDIYARSFETDMLGAKEVANISVARAKRQFAIGMPSWVRINLGLGPGERSLKGMAAGFVEPNHILTEPRETIQIDGVTIECVEAPGETPDTMVLWLPEQKILIGADNYYKSFPNLYPIRGSAYRDVALWVKSLDTMIAFEAKYLIPGHTRPLQGADHIREVLTNYRDGINHVLTETLAGMNEGATIPELIERVRLPEHLTDKPYLQEYYGAVSWSVHSIYTGYLGWFDGNPTNLHPLPRAEEAQHMADLAGGVPALFDQLQRAMDEDHHQWALQLADHLLALEHEPVKVTNLKADVLTALADQQINATARNYYLTYARELRQSVAGE